MKFKDIIINSNWIEIEKLLLTLDKNKDNLEGYKKVYDELKKLRPKRSDCVLSIKHVKNVEEEYEDVFGISKKNNQNYALDFTPWQEWLGMEIDQKT